VTLTRSKLIMKYLAYMGGYTNAGDAAKRGSIRSVEEQVCKTECCVIGILKR